MLLHTFGCGQWFKRFLSVVAVLLAVLVLANPVAADDREERDDGERSSSGCGDPTPSNVPEINPSAIAGGVTLLAGGVLILTSRRRRAAVPCEG